MTVGIGFGTCREFVCYSEQEKKDLSSCMHAQLLNFVQLFVIPWTVAHQALLSIGFSSQEYWSGLPFPPPGDLPDPGIEPTSLTSPALAGRFSATESYLGLQWTGYLGGKVF